MKAIIFIKNTIIFFLCLFLFISCSENLSCKNANSNMVVYDKFYKINDSILIDNGDTLLLTYHFKSDSIVVELKNKANNMFKKTLIIDDIIGEVEYKKNAYFSDLVLTSVDIESKEFIFTAYIKTEDDKKFEIEAVLVVNIKGEFYIVEH